MKLSRICSNIHFNNLKEPGAIVECIDTFPKKGIKYMVSDSLELNSEEAGDFRHLIYLREECKGFFSSIGCGGYFPERFKRIK